MFLLAWLFQQCPLLVGRLLVTTREALRFQHAESTQRLTLERTTMSQHWIADALQEHETAKARHQRSIAAHKTIIRVLRAFGQQTTTEALAIAQLDEAAASAVSHDGLVGPYHLTIMAHS